MCIFLILLLFFIDSFKYFSIFFFSFFISKCCPGGYDFFPIYIEFCVGAEVVMFMFMPKWNL